MEGNAAIIGAVLTFAYNALKFLIPSLRGAAAYWVFAGLSFLCATGLVLFSGGSLAFSSFPKLMEAFAIISGVALTIFNAIKFGPDVLTKAITGAVDMKKK